MHQQLQQRIAPAKSPSVDHDVRYRPDIDGLRGLASLAVILHSTAPPTIPPTTSPGIDVLFVISGFVVIGSFLSRPVAETPQEVWTKFYGRRLKRIWPSLLATGLGIGLLRAVFGSEPEHDSSCTLSLLALGNVHHALARTSSNVLADPCYHLWPLATLEQYYLILFPALVLISGTGRRVCRSRVQYNRASAKIFLSIVAAVSLALCGFLAAYYPDQALYQMPARCWQLILGWWLSEQQSEEVSEQQFEVCCNKVKRLSRVWVHESCGEGGGGV